MLNKNNKEIVMLLNKDDKIHDWILYDFSRRNNLPMRTMLVDKKELNKLRYVSIIDRKEIIYLKDEDKNILKHIDLVKKINLSKRVLVVSAQSKALQDMLKKIYKDKRVVEFPELKDYEQKQKQVIKVLRRWGVECQNKEIEKVLIRNMIRDVMSWEEVKLIWDVYSYKGQVIDKDTIEQLYPNEEFHKLDVFIIGILKGQWKTKGTQMAHYFLEVREYSPRWLANQILRVFMDIGLFFQAYRGGVIIMPETNTLIKERVNALNWENGLRLLEFREFEQEKYLNLVKEMPYKHYIKITKHVMDMSKNATTESIYKLIEEIKIIRGELVDDWGVQKYKRRKV